MCGALPARRAIAWSWVAWLVLRESKGDRRMIWLDGSVGCFPALPWRDLRLTNNGPHDGPLKVCERIFLVANQLLGGCLTHARPLLDPPHCGWYSRAELGCRGGAHELDPRLKALAILRVCSLHFGCGTGFVEVN